MPDHHSTAPTSTAVDERHALLHKNFLGVGLYGYVLNREQWLGRFGNGEFRTSQISLGSPPGTPS